MTDTTEFAVRSVLMGVGATVVMDLWAALLRRFGVPSLDMALLGRWVGHLAGGRWRHASIAKATPVRGERLIGWSAHYSIGIAFSALLLMVYGLEWAHAPTLLPALIVGIGTVVAPLFVLQPGMGAGVASRKTARPVFNAAKSVATHTVFGLGVYGAALVVQTALAGAR